MPSTVLVPHPCSPQASFPNTHDVRRHAPSLQPACKASKHLWLARKDLWFLEPYQKDPGQATTFLAHIKEGIEIRAKDGMLFFYLVVVRRERMLDLETRRRVTGLLLNQKAGLGRILLAASILIQ